MVQIQWSVAENIGFSTVYIVWYMYSAIYRKSTIHMYSKYNVCAYVYRYAYIVLYIYINTTYN